MSNDTDRELLEKAAKAAGMVGWTWGGFDMQSPPKKTPYGVGYSFWNPLADDAAALRLAVKLGIGIDTADGSAWKRLSDGSIVQEYWGGDFDPCYRRAIVRAAAALSTDGSGHER